MNFFFIFLFIPVFFSASVWALCVRQSYVDLKLQPKTKSEISWTVGKYMPLVEVSRRGKWLRVKDVDGAFHWSPQEALTAAFKCGVVKQGKVFLYREARAKAPISQYEFLDRYTPVRVLERDSGWYKVRVAYRGDFWVLSKNIWIPKSYIKVKF